jgi:putative protease
MTEGIAFCHEHGKKAYLTMNIIPHNKDIRDAREFLDDTVKAGIDAVIVSDPGTFNLVRNSHPSFPSISVHKQTPPTLRV